MASIRDKHVLRLNVSERRLPHMLQEPMRRCVHCLIDFQNFNSFYSELPPCAAADFSRSFLDALRVRVELTGHSPKTITANGPLIVVANHPLGLIDVMALDALMKSIRSDVSVMAVYLYASIPEYRDRFIFVGPRGNRRKRKYSVRGWRQSFRWIARGGVLIVFPASRVARFHWRSLCVADEPWSRHIAALARRTNAPVLPVYLGGVSGWGFQLAGILFPLLQNLRAIGSITSHRGRTLSVVVGRLIQPGDLSRFNTDEEATAFLRNETEMLARL
jgi:putative hemolysin